MMKVESQESSDGNMSVYEVDSRLISDLIVITLFLYGFSVLIRPLSSVKKAFEVSHNCSCPSPPPWHGRLGRRTDRLDARSCSL